MIKYFRRIRQILLSEGKLGRYLIYAVGEIILVVIGILIALQINNWNENKKLKEQEAEALTEIVSDLSFNIDRFHETLNGKNRPGNISNTLNSLDVIIGHLKSKLAYQDSLDVHFGVITFSLNVINYKTSGYESLSSVGLDLIQNTKLRSEIGEYYSSSIVIPKNVSDGLNRDFDNYMLDFIRKDFITNEDPNLVVYTLHPRNYDALREKGEFLESLKAYSGVYETYQMEINNAIKASNTLKSKIEAYLKG